MEPVNIYGYHAVKSALMVHPEFLLELYLLEKREDERFNLIKQLACQHNVNVKLVSRAKLNAIANATNHQGVVAKLSQFIEYQEADLDKLLTESPITILILDGVQDPHNLGACLRTANAMGAQLVLAPKDNAVGITSSVRKVACGAAEITPFIQATNLARTLRWLQQRRIWLVGTEMQADNQLADIDLTGDVALLLGGEAKGLRRLTKKHCDFLAKIPMRGAIESFNVSVATGICLYEVNRQRAAY